MNEETKTEASGQVLRGGVNTVRRSGDQIHRPAGAHTATVHRLLRHLRRRGVTEVPEPIHHDPTRGIETVSYLPGTTTNYPLRPPYQSSNALETAAKLLRRIHDATIDFEHEPTDSWYLPPVEPYEVICHGDYAPYNCAFGSDGKVTGVFDFDTAHPGPLHWDIGYAAYRWVPISTSADNDIEPAQQYVRLQQFCQAYGTDDLDLVLNAAADRLNALIRFIKQRAHAGDAAFIAHLAAGHDQLYTIDISHLQTFRTKQ